MCAASTVSRMASIRFRVMAPFRLPCSLRLRGCGDRVRSWPRPARADTAKMEFPNMAKMKAGLAVMAAAALWCGAAQAQTVTDAQIVGAWRHAPRSDKGRIPFPRGADSITISGPYSRQQSSASPRPRSTASRRGKIHPHSAATAGFASGTKRHDGSRYRVERHRRSATWRDCRHEMDARCGRCMAQGATRSSLSQITEWTDCHVCVANRSY